LAGKEDEEGEEPGKEVAVAGVEGEVGARFEGPDRVASVMSGRRDVTRPDGSMIWVTPEVAATAIQRRFSAARIWKRRACCSCWRADQVMASMVGATMKEAPEAVIFRMMS
jgi:hypothetical protein